jgi:hypothetical protein
MAGKKKKGGGKKKSGRLTKAEIKKAGGIKQAWAARKRGSSAAAKPKKKGGKKGGTKTVRHAARHSTAPKKKGGKRSGKKGGKRSGKKGGERSGGRRKSGSARISRSTIIRTSKSTQGVALVQIPKGAAETRRRGRKKGGGSARESSHRRGHRYAMENPMGGLELFVGGLTGVVGFVSADVLDRVLATHPLTASGSNDANGNAMYTDTLPTASTWRGNYSNLYNGTAVIAPMSLARWGIGILITVVPFVGAHFVKSPVGRSALQMFGFGFGMRVIGGGIVKAVASLTSKTAFGQRVFDAEIRANALYGGKAATLVQAAGSGTQQTTTAGTQIAPSVPTAGLGAAHTGLGDCGCMSCKQRFGCTSTSTPSAPPASPPVLTAPTAPSIPIQIVQPPGGWAGQQPGNPWGGQQPQFPGQQYPGQQPGGWGGQVPQAPSAPSIPPPVAPPVSPAQPAPPMPTSCPAGNQYVQASSVPLGVSPTYIVYQNTLNPSQAPQWQTPSQPTPPYGYVVGYCVPVAAPNAPIAPPMPVSTIPAPQAPIQIVKDPNAGFGSPFGGYIPPSALAHGNN